MEASQNRREFKFVLSAGLGAAVHERVARMMKPDRDAAEGYPVLSEYFDTRERSAYWQKQFGALNRRRIRTRVYGRRDGSISASAFIEVKHKLEGVTVKRRIAAGLEEIELLSKGHLHPGDPTQGPEDRKVRQEIADLVVNGGSRPVVQIRYHRHAYNNSPEGTLRITFDLDPRCRFDLRPLTPDDPDFDLPLLVPGSSIMEVKTIGSVPYWCRDLIGEFQLIPRGFSKYATSLELYELKIARLRPDLSDDKDLSPAESAGLIRRSPPQDRGSAKTSGYPAPTS